MAAAGGKVALATSGYVETPPIPSGAAPVRGNGARRGRSQRRAQESTPRKDPIDRVVRRSCRLTTGRPYPREPDSRSAVDPRLRRREVSRLGHDALDRDPQRGLRASSGLHSIRIDPRDPKNLYIYEALSLRFAELPVSVRPECPVCANHGSSRPDISRARATFRSVSARAGSMTSQERALPFSCAAPAKGVAPPVRLRRRPGWELPRAWKAVCSIGWPKSIHVCRYS